MCPALIGRLSVLRQLKRPQKFSAWGKRYQLWGVDVQIEGVSGKYFSDSRPVQSSKASYDTDVARRLWEVSEELTGTKFDCASKISQSEADVTTKR